MVGWARGNKWRVEAGEVAWATSVRAPEFCLESEFSLMEMRRDEESPTCRVISNSLCVTQSVPLQSLWISHKLSSTVGLKKYPSFKCHHFILFQLCCSCSLQISLRPLKLSWRISLASFSSISMIFPQVLNNGSGFSKVSDATWSDGCLLPSNPPPIS